MAGERNFTRIPPESTGDRVYMVHTMYLPYDGADANYEWAIGDRYYINGVGGDSITIHVHGVFKDVGATTGVLSAHIVGQDRFNNLIPINNQDIREESFTGTIRAQVNGTINVTNAFHDLYVPTTNIMGYDNPEHGLDIDVRGSANVRFAEGQPQLDAWGKLRTSGATLLGDYVFSNEQVLTENYSLVQTRINGGVPSDTTAFAEYERDPSDNFTRSVDVGVGNPTDLSTATSKLYHHYIAGSSHLFMGTCLFSGATSIKSPVPNGASRRFGTFDAYNGFMFHVGPDGNLYLERRYSNTNSGVKADVLIACSNPSVATALNIDAFNTDLLDGSRGASNPSGMELDLGKDNIYWIDIQWHGAGRVRFGTFHNGQRVVMHEYYHGNNYDVPMNQAVSLPVCTAVYGYQQSEIDANPYWSNVATGSIAKAVGGDVYVREFSQAVWSEVDIDLQQLGNPKAYASSHIPVTTTGFDSDDSYMFSLRVKALDDYGTRTNNSIIIPTKIAMTAYDANATGVQDRDAIVHFRTNINGVHHGHEWSSIPGTEMEVSTAGVNFEGADVEHRLFEDMANGRLEKQLTDTFIGLQKGTWKNAADDGGTAFEDLSSVTGSNTGSNNADGADTKSGTTELVMATVTGISAGTSLTAGGGIQAGTHVDAVNGLTLTLNKTHTVTTSASVSHTNPVAVTKNGEHWKLREAYTKTFPPNPGGGLLDAKAFDGLTLSSTDCYLFVTGKNTGVLYEDADYATPVTSTGSYSGSAAQLFGFIGPDYVVNFYAHEQIAAAEDPRVLFVVEWKEIKQ